MPVIAASERDETPRDEMVSNKVAASATPAPPREGPSDVPEAPAPAIASDQPNASIAQTEPPASATNVPNEQPAINSANTIHSVAQNEASGPPASSASDVAAELPNEPASEPTGDNIPAAKQTSSKAVAQKEKATRAVASNSDNEDDFAAKATNRSTAHAQPKSRLAKSEPKVRRARALPPIHVGSSPAELIDTTPDGRWILSIAGTGERVIVPPPPGYGR
jgi:hypothetical protein